MSVEGVVDHGLFCGAASEVVVMGLGGLRELRPKGAALV